jgi:predicted transposase YbfD/YdcC
MVVKANQATVFEDLATLFADPALVAETGTSARQVGSGHGRIERRELRTSTALLGYTAWPDLAQAVCVDRFVTHKRTGRRTHERAYAVTSLAPGRADARALLPLWREHWLIENRSHWVRDVTFGEDRSRVRSGSAPQVLAVLRNAVIGLLRAHGIHTIAAARRRYASHVEEAVALLGLPGQ